MRRIFLVISVLFIVCFMTVVACAQDSTKEQASKNVGMKIERGAKNLLLGWTELPKDIVNTTKESNALIGLTGGTVKGLFNTMARTLSGAIDILTFPMGTYEKPALKPSMTSDVATGGAAAK